jgi:type IV secretory pathway VirB2 component (pilin)
LGGFILNKKLVVVLLVLLALTPLAFAQADIDAITTPLTRIYDLLKSVVSVIAVIAITIAGARFMFSGDNIQQREASKAMVGYCIMGLVVIWVAPLMVNYLTAPMP